MLVETTVKQGSFYNALYQMIPDNHILKQINSAIDLSFVNELLADRYCKNFGRPAKEPEMMLRCQGDGSLDTPNSPDLAPINPLSDNVPLHLPIIISSAMPVLITPANFNQARQIWNPESRWRVFRRSNTARCNLRPSAVTDAFVNNRLFLKLVWGVGQKQIPYLSESIKSRLPDGTVLDIPCGTALFGIQAYTEKPNNIFIAFDYSIGMLRMAKNPKRHFR